MGDKPLTPEEDARDSLESYNDAMRAIGDKVKAGAPVPAFLGGEQPLPVHFDPPKVPALTSQADAEVSLKNIAVAEAAEDYWARAKDATQLFLAIKTKLEHQAAYIVWRQDAEIPSQRLGKQPKRQDGISDQQFHNLPASDPGAVVVHRWRKRLCVIQEKRWLADLEKIQRMLEDAGRRSVRICEQENANTIRGTEGTGEFERYTPAEYVERARRVLGAIDLDPASSELAQETVRAETYFAEADNGLAHKWHGRVWLNPPYHRELAPEFIDKLLGEIAAGHTTEAIVLTNNSTDTAWFRKAVDQCQCVCFTTGRINFTVPGRDPVLPTQGQAFFYFGHRSREFIDGFAEIGFCMRPVRR